MYVRASDIGPELVLPILAEDSNVASIEVLRAQLREPSLRNALSEIYELYDAMESIIKNDTGPSTNYLSNHAVYNNMEVLSNVKAEIKNVNKAEDLRCPG